MRSRWDPSLLNRRGVAHNPTNVHQDSINRSNFSELDPVSRKNVTILITNRVQKTSSYPRYRFYLSVVVGRSQRKAYINMFNLYDF
jgi:hypothetical protein